MTQERNSKMLDDAIFRPETIAAFRQVCSEKKDTLEYMQKFGAPIEKSDGKNYFFSSMKGAGLNDSIF